MTGKFLLLSVLLIACDSPCKPLEDMDQPQRDAAIVDLSTSAPDLAEADLDTCIKCNALINPCPAKGLYCDSRNGCCSGTPH
jgi:hypothetical protein